MILCNVGICSYLCTVERLSKVAPRQPCRRHKGLAPTRKALTISTPYPQQTTMDEMKKLLVIALLMLTASVAQAQTDNAAVKDTADEIMVFCEEMPQFPGGDEAMMKYVGSNLRYPDVARAKNVEGKVLIQFVVEKDGSVSNVAVKSDIGGGCGEEAARVVQAMPRWTPGKMGGKAVRFRYTLPISFKLQE